MTDDPHQTKDEDLEAFARATRPNRAKTAAIVFAVIATLFVGCTLLVTRLDSAEDSTLNGATHHDAVEKPAPTDDSRAGLPLVNMGHGRGHSAFAIGRQAVAIRTVEQNASEDGAFGSGFLIADTLIISAAHIVTSAAGHAHSPVRVLCDDTERDGTVTAIDPVRDVMVITAPECHGGTIAFRLTKPSPNDGLHISGFTFIPSRGQAYWFHHCTSLIPGVQPDTQREDMEEELKLRIDAMHAAHVLPYLGFAGSFVPGNSGSAIYDDQGEIVGMLVIADSRLNRTYAVPSVTILDVLTRAGITIP